MSCIEVGTKTSGLNTKNPGLPCRSSSVFGKGLLKTSSNGLKEEDNSIELIHATEPIELRDANKLWLEQSQWMYPKYKSLEAYVSFFAFGRFVKA